MLCPLEYWQEISLPWYNYLIAWNVSIVFLEKRISYLHSWKTYLTSLHLCMSLFASYKVSSILSCVPPHEFAPMHHCLKAWCSISVDDVGYIELVIIAYLLPVPLMVHHQCPKIPFWLGCQNVKFKSKEDWEWMLLQNSILVSSASCCNCAPFGSESHPDSHFDQNTANVLQVGRLNFSPGFSDESGNLMILWCHLTKIDKFGNWHQITLLMSPYTPTKKKKVLLHCYNVSECGFWGFCIEAIFFIPQAFEEFVQTFDEEPASSKGKVWVKAGTFNAGTRGK